MQESKIACFRAFRRTRRNLNVNWNSIAHGMARIVYDLNIFEHEKRNVVSPWFFGVNGLMMQRGGLHGWITVIMNSTCT